MHDAVAALVVAILNPLFGSIVDNTRFRKSVASGSLFLLGVIQLCQVLVNKDTWFVVTLLQVPAIACTFVHSAAASAYLPETSSVRLRLSDDLYLIAIVLCFLYFRANQGSPFAYHISTVFSAAARLEYRRQFQHALPFRDRGEPACTLTLMLKL